MKREYEESGGEIRRSGAYKRGERSHLTTSFCRSILLLLASCSQLSSSPDMDDEDVFLWGIPVCLSSISSWILWMSSSLAFTLVSSLLKQLIQYLQRQCDQIFTTI